MKRSLLTFILFIIAQYCCIAQHNEIWGTTLSGGKHIYGTIYKFNEKGENFEAVHHLFNFNGTEPGVFRLVDIDNNYLLGIMNGAIFKIDTQNLELSLAEYTGPIGDISGSLTKTSDNRILGITSNGGLEKAGLIFEYFPKDNRVDTIISLKNLSKQGKVGVHFQGSLVEGNPGKFYCATLSGGDIGGGSIIEIDINTKKVRKLWDFFSSFSNSKGSFMKASNGKLYGAFGYILEYDPIKDTMRRINGVGRLLSDFIEGNNRKLYAALGKSIYMYDIGIDSVKRVADLSEIGGSFAEAGLLQASNGKLYGTTRSGGDYNDGLIFEYDIDQDSLIKKFDFNKYETGQDPRTSLFEIKPNKLLGFTRAGGGADKGTYFEFDITTNSYKTLLDLAVPINGYKLSGSIIQASDQMVYGTTEEGGKHNNGVLFQFNPSTNFYNKIFDFYDSLPSKPNGELVEVDSLSLVGTLSSTFTSDKIFKYNILDSSYQVLYEVNDSTLPSLQNGLVKGDSNNLYGTLGYAGLNRDGAIFRFNWKADEFEILHYFDSASGRNPLGRVILKDSLIYGTTVSGGKSGYYGVLFEFNVKSKQYKVLHHFDKNAYHNSRKLTLSKNKLYGSLEYELGRVFEYNLSDSTFKFLHTFNLENGGTSRKVPLGGFYIDKQDILFGINWGRGPDNDGQALFRLNTINRTYTEPYKFVYPDGIYPQGPLTAIDYCRPAEKPTLIYGKDSICSNTWVQVKVDPRNRLNRDAHWIIYTDSLTRKPIDSSKEGSFNLLIDSEKTYFISGNGSCKVKSPQSTLSLNVRTEKAIYYADTFKVCYLEDFTFSDGSSKTQIKENFTYIDSNSTTSGCDSIITTYLEVYPKLGIKDSSNILVSEANNAVYQWVNCRTNEAIPGENNRLFYPADTGLYAVRVTQNACSALSKCILVLHVGLEENSLYNTTSISPNPISGNNLNIITNKLYRELEIQIFNVQGKQIANKTFSSQKEIQVEINGNPGVYIIQLRNELGETANFKLLKE